MMLTLSTYLYKGLLLIILNAVFNIFTLNNFAMTPTIAYINEVTKGARNPNKNEINEHSNKLVCVLGYIIQNTEQ